MQYQLQPVMALISRELLRSKRFFGLELLGPAIMSVLFLTIFKLSLGEDADTASLNGISLLSFVASGFVGLSIMQFCFYASAYSLMFDKLERMIEDLLAAPINGLEIASGYIIASVLRGVVVCFSVLLILDLMVPIMPQNWLLLGFFAIFGALSMAGISIISAIFSAKWDSLAAKESFFAIPLLQLSGAFFPLSAIESPFWQFIMSLNPFYYTIDGVRYAITGVGEASLSMDIWVTLLTSCVCIGIAAILFSTGYKIKN